MARTNCFLFGLSEAADLLEGNRYSLLLPVTVQPVREPTLRRFCPHPGSRLGHKLSVKGVVVVVLSVHLLHVETHTHVLGAACMSIYPHRCAARNLFPEKVGRVIAFLAKSQW